MWSNGVVRSTVGATATTALVATMMFGGGGFNPAVAAPVDNQDSGIEQQLRDAVEETDAAVESGEAKKDAKTEAPADTKKPAPEENPVEEPAAAPKSEVSAEAPKPTPSVSEKSAEPSEAPKPTEEPATPSPATAAPKSSEAPAAPVEEKEAARAAAPVARAAEKPGESKASKAAPEKPEADKPGTCNVGSFVHGTADQGYTSGLLVAYERAYVNYSLPLSGLKIGENKFSFEYTDSVDGIDAIESVGNYRLTNGGSVTGINVSTDGKTATATMTLNANSPDGTLSFDALISSVAGKINASNNSVDIKVQVVSLDCAKNLGKQTLNIKVRESIVAPPETATVKIQKILVGESKVVDKDRKYSGTVTCSNDGKIITGTWETKAGAAAFEVVFANGDKATVGSDCTATENALAAPSADPSYVFETPSIDGLTNLGANGGTIRVTNKVKQYEGNLKVAKTVIDPANGYLDWGLRDFEINYVCSNPSDTNAQKVDGSFGLSTRDPRTTKKIPYGWNCEFNETAPDQDLLRHHSFKWGAPSIDRPNVTMGADTTGSTVTVTNTVGRGTGALEISKSIPGDLAGSVDEGITFTGTWTCTYGNATRNGEWSLKAGGSKTVATDLLAGSDCTVAEDATEQEPNAKDASYGWLPAVIEGNHAAITAKKTAKVGVVNSIERKLGTLQVTKTLSGETAGFTGGDREGFEVTYTCVNPSDDEATPVSGSVLLVAGGTKTVESVPFGWDCEIDETAPGADLLKDGSFVWGAPEIDRAEVSMGAETSGSTVTVTNPIGRGYGALEINKSIAGDLAGSVDEGITFTGTWTCTYDGESRTGEWSLNAGESKTVATDLLIGSDCTVAEDATEQEPNAKDASYKWLPAAIEGNHATVTANETAHVGVVNSIERKLGTLQVTKKLGGETAGFTGGDSEGFEVTYTCVNPLNETATPVSGSVLLAVGGAKTVESVPFGWDCEFSETTADAGLLKDGSFVWGTPEIDRAEVSMGADTNGSTVSVTNPIGRGYGALEISKRLAGDLAEAADEGITFTGTWSCTYGEATRNGEWSLEAGESKTVATDLLIGSDCTVAEDTIERKPNTSDRSYGWLPAVIEGNHATITADPTALVTVVNSIERKLGSLQITKKLGGETEGFTGGASESFEVTYTCVNPLEMQPKAAQARSVSGSVLLAAGGTKAVGEIPFGWDCEFDETSPGADLLEDGSFVWGAPEIDRAEVSMGADTNGSTVTVTNPIERNLGAVDVDKSVGATEYLGGGKWKITYDITVKNQLAAQSIYTLNDKLNFGEGLTVDSARYQESGGEWTAWADTAEAAVLATDRKIDGMQDEEPAQHTYQVEVMATVPAEIIGSDAATCDASEESAGGGFLNTVTVTAGEHSASDAACATPMPTELSYSMVKTSDPASGETVSPGDEVAYTVAVKNTGEFVYTGAIVTDEMSGWQQAATLNEGSLDVSGGAVVTEGSQLLWTVGDLAVGETKTLTYSVTVKAEAWDQFLVNVATGNSDVQPSTTTHPTPEYHKLPEPPVVIEPPVVEPPVVETPEQELPGEETEVPVPPVVVVPPVEEEPAPELPGKESEVAKTPEHEEVAPKLHGKEEQDASPKREAPLASTGASDATLWVAGSAALVMLLGAALVIGSRRRKGKES